MQVENTRAGIGQDVIRETFRAFRSLQRVIAVDNSIAHIDEIKNEVAVRMGNWKAFHKGADIVPWELYDLSKDIGEKANVAAQHPSLVRRMLDQAEQCRADLGDTTLNRTGTGVRPPGGVK